ncbi:unnamed protein product [Eretmochelys imbricata]
MGVGVGDGEILAPACWMDRVGVMWGGCDRGAVVVREGGGWIGGIRRRRTGLRKSRRRAGQGARSSEKGRLGQPREEGWVGRPRAQHRGWLRKPRGGGSRQVAKDWGWGVSKEGEEERAGAAANRGDRRAAKGAAGERGTQGPQRQGNPWRREGEGIIP